LWAKPTTKKNTTSRSSKSYSAALPPNNSIKKNSRVQ
jgi:hypothetical protein